MTDRPIIFSGPMVRALLDGRKTQTRQVLHRLRKFGPITEFGTSDTEGYDWHFRDRGMRWHDLHDERLREVLPAAVGDRLWVRERAHIDGRRINFAADCPCNDLTGLGYRPSIHLPRWASRRTLIVTDVRVERLQDISAVDAEAEGVFRHVAEYSIDKVYRGERGETAVRYYADLWNSLHGPDAWDANPWVAAITFRTVRANIDRLPADALPEAA